MKYSVVMPIYNVCNYLESAINDILAQTYCTFELILIDDASVDSSGDIADLFAEKDKRIVVKHLEKNQGLSNARNEGMKAATGDYILFLDSDDRYESDLLEKIENSLLKNKAKVVLYGLTEEYFDKSGDLFYKKEIVPHNLLLHKKAEVRRQVMELETKTLFGYAWNKAYDLKFLKENDIYFEKVQMIEDVLFNIKVFQDLESLNLIADASYHYAIRNNGSLTHKFLPEYFYIHENRVRAMLELHRQWGMDNDVVLEQLGNIYCRYFISALQRNCSIYAEMDFNKRRKWIKDKFKSGVYLQLKRKIRPHNLTLKILAFGIRHGNITICQAMGRMIFIIKEKFPDVFSRLKQKR